MYSINVLLITYNQEKLVGNAIESVIGQKEFGLNKLIVLDDCSTDGNWDVIQSYKNQYSDYIVTYRNETNIGGKSLYQNFWKLYTLRGDSDLYCFISGDDVFCDGWFCAVQNLIKEKGIDVRNKASLLLGDTKILFPNGEVEIDSHASLIERGLKLMRMRVRGIVSSCPIMSKKLMERYQKPILDEGLCLAEEMFDNNKFYYCDEAYYCKCVGYEYHVGIGVSRSIASTHDYYRSLIHAIERSKQLYELCVKDQYWMDFKSYRLKYMINPTVILYVKMCVAYFNAFDWPYNRITIKSDLKWFLKDSLKPCIKKLLGINRQHKEPKAINI